MPMLFNPTDVREGSFIVHAIASSGVAYARPLSDDIDGQVFIGQNVVTRFEMRPGDTFVGRIVPNYPDRQDIVPWRLIYVAGTPPSKEVPAPKVQGPTPEVIHSITERSVKDGRVWTSREIWKDIFNVPLDDDLEEQRTLHTIIVDKLMEMCRDGLLYRLALYKDDMAYAIYYSTDIDALTPDGYK